MADIRNEIIDQFVRYSFEKSHKKKVPIFFPFRGDMANDDSLEIVKDFLGWLRKEIDEKTFNKISEYFLPKSESWLEKHKNDFN